jgi:hypothetical protein
MIDFQGGPLREFHKQFKFAPHSLDVAAQRRQIHVGLLIDLGDRWPPDVERLRNVSLGLAGNLAKLAKALDFLAES